MVGPLLANPSLAIAQDRKGADEEFPGNRYVKVRLAFDTTAITPGKPSLLAVVFDISKGWHLYWRNPGDSGLPPRVAFKLPKGLTITGPKWPAPKRHVESEMLVDYVYEDQLVLVYAVEASEQFAAGQTVAISADVDWLVCREKCVPGKVTAKTESTIASSTKLSPDADLFSKTSHRLPLASERGPKTYQTRWEGRDLVIEAKGATRLAFYPYESDADTYPEDMLHRGETKAGSLRLTYPEVIEKRSTIGGIVAVTRSGKEEFYELKLPPPRK